MFDEINAGNYWAMVESLGEPFEYHFHGDHALGGRRTSVDAMNRWWARLMRLLPDARFEVLDVLVRGWPWRTRVAVRARVTGDLPGGERYENTVFQSMTLVGGRVTSVDTVCEPAPRPSSLGTANGPQLGVRLPQRNGAFEVKSGGN
ncbi:nuclear transport factor 2 family protein [Leucobacter albus]|uniref:Nuclear transport factor 2 family protein n=1 Tax=Leucobacter albus TaxID=272210 RepID=A0ABW3TS74_9MICO